MGGSPLFLPFHCVTDDDLLLCSFSCTYFLTVSLFFITRVGGNDILTLIFCGGWIRKFWTNSSPAKVCDKNSFARHGADD